MKVEDLIKYIGIVVTTLAALVSTLYTLNLLNYNTNVSSSSSSAISSSASSALSSSIESS